MNQMLRETFKIVFDQLNAAQRRAVEMIEGPVMVIAGPGTGKTQLLSARICNICLQTPTDPSEILCLTYTDAGSIAMRKRLEEMMGSDASKVNIFTFHSFCSYILAENSHTNPSDSEEIISEIEQHELIRTLLDGVSMYTPLKMNLNDPYVQADSLLRFFSVLKENELDPIEVRTAIEEHLILEKKSEKYEYLKASGENKKGDFKQKAWDEYLEKIDRLLQALALYPTYQELLRQNRFIEFQDLINRVVKLFSERDDLLENYQIQFQYLLVDEFQDTNDAQLHLLNLLCNPRMNNAPNVFVVGDDDQSIYKFQGANIANIYTFYKDYILPLDDPEEIAQRVIVLGENYRSSQKILDFAQHSIAPNKQRIQLLINEFDFDKNIVAKNIAVQNLQTTIKIWECESEEDECIAIGDKIKHLIEAENVQPREIAVLYTNHKIGNRMSRYFDFIKVPYEIKKNANIVNSPMIQDLIAALEYVLKERQFGFKNERLFFDLLYHPWNQISPVSISKCAIDFQQFKIRKNDHTSDKEFVSLRNFIETRPSIDPKITKLYETTELQITQLSRIHLVAFIEQVVHQLGIIEWIIRQPNRLVLLQELNTFFEFVKEQKRKKPKLELKEFIDTMHFIIDQELEIPLHRTITNKNAVQCLTIYASKGLEYEHVFLIDNRENNWEKKRGHHSNLKLPVDIYLKLKNIENTVEQTYLKKEKEDQLEELRRLFFVGVTRAKKELILSYPSSSKGKGINKTQFLTGISPDLVEYQSIAIDASKKEAYLISQMLLNDSKSFGLIENEFIAHQIHSLNMSSSALDTYLECPLSYYYEKILKIPAMPDLRFIKGTIIHHSLEWIASEIVQSGNIPSKESFFARVQTELHNELRFFNESEQKNHEEFFNEALSSYYDEKIVHWNTSLEVEKELSASYQEVPIIGYLDKIEHNMDGTINIIDYKSGKLDKAKKYKNFEPPADPSTWKNKDEGTFQERFGGKYWRQAVIYAYLWQSIYPSKPIKEIRFEFVIDTDSRFGHQIVHVNEESIAFILDQIKQTYSNIQNRIFEGCGKETCKWCQKF
jgi:DNA helicase-2/ATP-dependent DNA helicase PcrA